MQSAQRIEYDDLVNRVRRQYGSGVEIGGYNSHDLIKLRKLAAQADIDRANELARRPISDAGTRLHYTRERVMAAWRKISDGQATIAKNRRLHRINGAPVECFEEVELPQWQGPALSTVDGYDAANAETSVIATEFETRAQKIFGYVNSWEQSTIEQQNRSLILAMADRMDRMEARDDS
jgi:hypothetical protein